MSALTLVAASDPRRAERIRVTVEKECGRIVTALDASEAMRLFVRSAPDLTIVLLDPEGELAPELCRDMRSLRGASERKILVIGERGDRQAAFKAGCDAFVVRQSDARPLAIAVRRLIGAARPRTYDAIESVA